MAVGLIIGLIVGVVALIVWLWNGSEVRVAVDKLPGPRALPFIGNAHMFKPDGRGKVKYNITWSVILVYNIVSKLVSGLLA